MSLRIVASLCTAVLLLPSILLADPGLVARYTDGKRTVAAVVAAPSFGLKDNESVHPQVAPAFTATYEGSLKVLRRAKYAFAVGDAKLTLDGKAVAGPIELEPGEHEIQITYERKPGAARFQPAWSSEFFIPEPLPAPVLSHKAVPKEADQQALIERGRTVVEEHNCAGCHRGGGSQNLASRVGPDLTNIGGRANAFWIYKWLENPQHFRAAAVMPTILSEDEDRRDVAAYLATLKDAKKKITEYRGSAAKAKQGKELFDSIGCANCHGETGPALTGMGSKTTLGQLAAYLEDPTSVDRSGRMPGMQLTKDEAVSLANHLMQSSAVDFEGKMPVGANVEHGQQLVRTAGCLNCHTIEGDAGKPLSDAKKFAALDKVDPAKGCLSDKPIEPAARYNLSAEDRKAAAAFVSAIKTAPLISSAPAHEFHRTLAKLNCAACHETDSAKPSEDIEKLPPLTNVGAKLRREWIQQVLTDKKARVRFWLKTRMPEFGGAISRVPEQAVAAAGVEEAEAKVTIKPALIARGQELVGANDPKKNPTGMGCVTCHSLREFKPAVAADATRGPELTLMSTRLRGDFFTRWMHEPARIQAGTAMPNFFTDKSREEANLVIDTLWSYASLGQGMPAPRGVKEKKNYTLIVMETPLIQRCQIPDGGGTIVYGISVGLPQLINYTFDAQAVMFRAAWQGGFLDMNGDWDGRGGNPVRLLGQRFYSQSASPLHIGAPDADAPRVFKGYELRDKIPTFIYTVGDVEVRERITAAPEGAGIVRTFELDPAGKPVFFTATDEANVTLSASTGAFKPAEVQKSFRAPDKAPGQILELPGNAKLNFSITIKAKDGK